MNHHKKIFWPLNQYLDIKPLEDLHLDICRGIALSNRDFSTRLIPHYEMKGDIKSAIDFKSREKARINSVSDDASQMLTPEELKIYQSLSHNQKRNFLEVYKGAYTDGEFVRIRFTKEQNLLDKFSTFYSESTEWTENSSHFSSLLKWISGLPFTDVGRILIFISKHHLHGDLHYDRKDDWLDGRHHFIWFNPFLQKKFFLYEGLEPIQVNSKALFFDTSYIHGSGIHEKTVYSLRIDGQLDEGFCKLAGIPWRKR